ncbi:HAD family hydrolase [Saliphagus infecundisoli]|uniref:HAD family hydrolase n=1 Tax=Saliphagus infecundisoli TaxID=1849069 RepID=A0ABD5QGH9_9EURY|nr:HAD family hydrolase [Saliphagus infecundisoli]
MPTAVVFDLDDTLAVPDRDRETVLAEAVERADAPAIAREEYLAAHGRNLTRESREPIFADLLADSDADPEAVAAAYRKRTAETIGPVPGAETMVETLRDRYRVGLLTNGPVRAQREKLATLGWEGRFDAAFVTGELEAGKPDPRAFEAILAALGVAPGEAVYVGDDPETDVTGAVGAGMDAVHVHERGETPDSRAVAGVIRDRIAEDLPRILADLE